MGNSSATTIPYRELTLPAILLGVAVGVVLNIALIYSALKLGFAIGGSAIAALIGYVVLRHRSGRGTIIENNLNQTIASAIITSGSGVVFTLPTLFFAAPQRHGSGFFPVALAGGRRGRGTSGCGVDHSFTQKDD